MKPVDQLRSAIICSEWADETDIQGCTEEEIVQLETLFKVRLPHAYKEFLRSMGQGAGEFEDNSLWTMSELPQARVYAESYLEQLETPYSLPAKAFVFCVP